MQAVTYTHMQSNTPYWCLNYNKVLKLIIMQGRFVDTILNPEITGNFSYVLLYIMTLLLHNLVENCTIAHLV